MQNRQALTGTHLFDSARVCSGPLDLHRAVQREKARGAAAGVAGDESPRRRFIGNLSEQAIWGYSGYFGLRFGRGACVRHG